MALQSRNEMDPAFQWNLNDIYPSQEAWDAACNSTAAMIPAVAALRGTLCGSAASLKAGLDRVYQTCEPVIRLLSYADLLRNADNGDQDAQKLYGRAQKLYTEYSAAASFVDPEILSIPADTLHSWMKDDTLAEYRYILEKIDRERAHTLPAEQEKMLSLLADAASTPDDIFTMLLNVDTSFPDIHDEQGQPVTLSHGSYGVYLRSRDREVRRNAFETFAATINRYRNTLAATYVGSIRLEAYFTKQRGYESTLARSLAGSNVPLSVYSSLIEAVHGGLPVMQRYLRLRKRVLKLDELHMYDLYTPIVDSVDYHLTLDETKTLVKQALLPLGEGYQQLLNRACDEQWMDIYENKGKTTGAFSYGVHGVHPYVLLNFNGTLNDAFTMAHELGHAMHSWYSSANNSFANHSYRLLVAEVASTVNEVLLSRYLLQTETDPKRRAYLLNNLLEAFRTTVFRQTLFAEFEQQAHALYAGGETPTADTLCQIYRELNERYYSECFVDALQDIEWARVPHFYSSFYVYQYATGYCSAVAIASRILETGDATDYLHFLTTGASMDPMDELKLAGVDLTKPEVVASALSVFENTLSQLEQLLDTAGAE